ncbi:hypothetical protein EUGRSUZ_E01632 [Eucalyptus grandis]|uniref:Uncharacterized protein n=2 Tax=Eucalyptus grandis TaxID=71139 RepID=A0ACC3KV32_EUCGR|nr:hypothetical protein EUGRSUZ_E01632 [Eucalyptus grandis]
MNNLRSLLVAKLEAMLSSTSSSRAISSELEATAPFMAVGTWRVGGKGAWSSLAVASGNRDYRRFKNQAKLPKMVCRGTAEKAVETSRILVRADRMMPKQTLGSTN